MSKNVEYIMDFTTVLDSDGLIKLAKAGVLEFLVSHWSCLIPQAVYSETVEHGIKAGYPDALAIRQALPLSIVRPRVRHPRATALLQGKRNLGAGEREALHLFLAMRADVIITDDAAFVAVLARAGLPYLLPASVLIQLSHQGHLDSRTALEGLMRMRPLIRPEVYQAARRDLGTHGSPKPDEPQDGGLP